MFFSPFLRSDIIIRKQFYLSLLKISLCEKPKLKKSEEEKYFYSAMQILLLDVVWFTVLLNVPFCTLLHA